jgi:hypothetical protein
MCHRQHRHESSARQGIEAVNIDARRQPAGRRSVDYPIMDAPPGLVGGSCGDDVLALAPAEDEAMERWLSYGAKAMADSIGFVAGVMELFNLTLCSGCSPSRQRLVRFSR